MKPILSILLLGSLVFAGPSYSSAQEAATGSISGTVWHDTNLDGVRQPDEPMLSIPLTVDLPLEGDLHGGRNVLTTRSGADGSYKFEDLKPGSYLIQTQPVGQAFLATYPAKIVQGQITQAVAVVAGGTTNANLGLVMNFARSFATAWVDATQLEKPQVAGFVGGVQCAYTPRLPLLPTDTGPGFVEVYFLPEGLIAGCGVPGSTVTFKINGRAANETIPYPARPAFTASQIAVPRPLPLPSDTPPRILSNLTAGAPFAHFGGSRPFGRVEGGSIFDPAGEVTARVNGVECGSLQFSFGGYSISIPAAGQPHGCGFDGAIVEIFIGQMRMATQAWLPGFHRLDLVLPEDSARPPSTPAVSTTQTIRPPDTGDAGLK